jgi:hypothetical protein
VPASATEREAKVREAFAVQAEWCAQLGSPLTSRLCRLLGERLGDETEVGRRVLGWEGDPSSKADALPLRLTGGLHALVRSGNAPGFASCYPPNPLPDDERLWAAVREALDAAALLPWLELPPQTNEVGRSAVLMSGLLVVASHFAGEPLHLLELGASAGLNLLLDRYRYDLGGLAAGDPCSPLLLRPEWEGPPPPQAHVRIASRSGVDLAPVDPAAEGERLLAYAWPDQAERMERLESALRLAATDPPQVDAGDAADWIERRLAEPPPANGVRVVMHSIAFQYFPDGVQRRVTQAIEAAGAKERLAWLRYEFAPGDKGASLRLRTWPGGEDRLLAWCHPHGREVSWVG